MRHKKVGKYVSKGLLGILHIRINMDIMVKKVPTNVRQTYSEKYFFYHTF